MHHEDDDLYTRCQMLTSLISVLVHDLRNPLHSAILVLEAMGHPSADGAALRDKLRGQVGKLDGLIDVAAGAMKELALEPQVAPVQLDALLGSLAARYRERSENDVPFSVPSAPGIAVAVDHRLIERVLVEVAAVIAEHAPSDAGPPAAKITLEEPESGMVCLWIGDLEPNFAASLAKGPFAIAGGVSLATARSLAQSAGGTLRLAQGADGVSRFTLLLRRSA